MLQELLAAYDSERLKTLAVWSAFGDDDLSFRPARLARTPHEHMVHQCVSEDTWMRTMLDVSVAGPVLPPVETRLGFLERYATTSAERLDVLRSKPTTWWDATTTFFDVERTRSWVMIRRLVHSAHHRAQLTVYLRLLDRPLYSTYGPTADTGGLFQNKAPVIYRYASVADLLEREASGGENPPLPGPGATSPTERPDRSL